MNRPRHIGIVACSAEGAALCYRTICSESTAILGQHNHPEISMHTIPLAAWMHPIDEDRWDEVGEMLLASAQKVVDAGAEILLTPDNTIHQGLDLVRDRAPAPWLHIAEEVASVAAERGFSRLALLGTRYLMEGPVYPPKLAALGIERELPSREQRERINSIIFDELVYGRFEDSARREMVAVIEELAARGCDAAILGCTEIPLLISEADSPLPVLDSTRILARAAIREATK
jgi:aspartate racemase